MDGGPFRSQRPAERRATTTRPEATQVTAQEPMAEPRRVAANLSTKSPRRKRWGLMMAIPLLLLLFAAGVWLGYTRLFGGGAMPNIDTSKYQAVFLTNGQVYFGKVQSSSGDYVKMTDVYYLQTDAANNTSENPQKTSEAEQSNVRLLKLGDAEIHGPENEMVVMRSQVLLYENLKSDSKVVQAIGQYKTPK